MPTTRMAQTETGLWAPTMFVRHHQEQVRTIILPTGERAKETIDDSGTVTHIETDERLDAIVRPKPVLIKLRRA